MGDAKFLDIAKPFVWPRRFALKSRRDIWKAAAILNEIRNKLAHKTEPVGVDQKIDDFHASCRVSMSQLADRQNQFELNLWVLFEAVSSLVERPTPTVLALRNGNRQ